MKTSLPVSDRLRDVLPPVVSRADDGRVMVLDDGFGGTLLPDGSFTRALPTADELKDEFRPVLDSAEVAAAVSAARAAASLIPKRDV